MKLATCLNRTGVKAQSAAVRGHARCGEGCAGKGRARAGQAGIVAAMPEHGPSGGQRRGQQPRRAEGDAPGISPTCILWT